MSSVHSVGSMNQLADALDNAGYTPEDVTLLRQGNLPEILGFLHGKAKLVPVEWKAANAIIKIDRSKPFDPASFISKGWKIVEQDERSLAISELDLNVVRLERMLKSKESYIDGEENLRRLKSTGHIRLDAKIFEILWNNQQLIPEKWKEKTDGKTTFIFFDGTILLDPGGDRYAHYLDWNDGRWRWRCYWLDSYRNVNDSSAVLASVGA